MKRVLIACEYSGTVREAFKRRGFDAWSCDLLPTEIPGQHIDGDVLQVFRQHWDLIIAHPPCTHLAVSGAKHFPAKRADGRQAKAIEFFLAMANAPANYVAVENPVCIMSSIYRPADQIIQPYMFGHEATKTTCLWLKNLPKLKPTNVVGKGERAVTKGGKSLPKWYNLPPSPDRWKERSRTFKGIADAMAEQWGDAIMNNYQMPVQKRLFEL